jgi:hypothetical protein
VETADKSGSVKIISGWADADISITLLLIDIPKYTGNTVTPDQTRARGRALTALKQSRRLSNR